jgi:hypothetical protein
MRTRLGRKGGCVPDAAADDTLQLLRKAMQDLARNEVQTCTGTDGIECATDGFSITAEDIAGAAEVAIETADPAEGSIMNNRTASLSHSHSGALAHRLLSS